MERITSAFPETIPETIEDFFLFSRQFSERSGLITREVKTITRLCDTAGVPSGMTMLGNGIFAYGRKAHNLLMLFGHVYEFHVADSGAHIVEDYA
jgi:pantoate kinase